MVKSSEQTYPDYEIIKDIGSGLIGFIRIWKRRSFIVIRYRFLLSQNQSLYRERSTEKIIFVLM